MTFKDSPGCVTINGNEHICYDDELLSTHPRDFFDSHFLEANGLIAGKALGRGSVFFIQYSGMDLVLKHYHRGGVVSKIFKDRYLGFRVEQTRAWREFIMLKKMCELGLPVPRPVAARVEMKKFIYTADLITQRIMNVRTLVDALIAEGDNLCLWKNVGRCVRKFHDLGVYHHDLNARNILIGADMNVHMIDFDHCEFRSGGKWQSLNMLRLKRSLKKTSNYAKKPFYSDEKWKILNDGYSNLII